MNYTIEKAENGNYLIIKVIGKITIPFALEYVNAAHLRAKELGIDKLLYDVTEAENVESALENFSMVHDELPRLKIRRVVQVVMLASPQDHSHDFVETASRNAGYNVTICRDMKSALAKLGETTSESVQG